MDEPRLQEYTIPRLDVLQQLAETYLVPAQLVLAMLGMGATLSWRSVADILTRPTGIMVGLALHLVWVPALAIACASLFDVGPGFAVGLFLAASVPGGTIANLMTYAARGNVALAITLTTVSTFACILTAPVLLRLLADDALPHGFVFPTWAIVRDVMLYLLVPLAAGLVVRERFAARAPRIAAWSIRTSVGLIVILSVLSLASKRIEPTAYGWYPPAVIVVFVLALITLTPYVARMLGRYDDDAAALAIGVTLRNMGVALLLVRFFFPGRAENGHVLFTCLFYAGVALPSSIPLVLRHRRGKSALVVGPPRPRPAPAE